jgi:hypothetical protein
LTNDGKNSETKLKETPEKKAAPDPRVLAFVRMLARRAAERDYARHLESHGKASQPSRKE